MEERGLTVTDLEFMKFSLEAKIKKNEQELIHPDESLPNNQIILKRLLEIERSNLRKVKFEIEVKKSGP